VKCGHVVWYIVVFDRKTKLTYNNNTQLEAFHEDSNPCGFD
jgi:hypothetical protein